MASKIGLSYRREAVMDRFRHEANRLRSRGVDVGSFPEGGRDAEVRALDQLAYAADLLAAANDRLDEVKAEIEAIGDQSARLAELETATSEHDQEIAARDARITELEAAAAADVRQGTPDPNVAGEVKIAEKATSAETEPPPADAADESTDPKSSQSGRKKAAATS